jgi:hypothetical protein
LTRISAVQLHLLQPVFPFFTIISTFLLHYGCALLICTDPSAGGLLCQLPYRNRTRISGFYCFGQSSLLD